MTTPSYRWSTREFLRAWDAGVFDHRVELIDGQIYPVVLGDWHGSVTPSLGVQLRTEDVVVTCSSLKCGDSILDPDWWVRPRAARPVAAVTSRLHEWNPDDALVVVEVSEEPTWVDLATKAELYGSAGYPVYWVVTQDAVYVHTEPSASGYLHRETFPRGALVSLPYTNRLIDVSEIIDR